MSMPAVDVASLEDGLYAIEAEFYTEHFVLRATVISPEMRLSDHLNSATSTLELRPSQVRRVPGASQVHVAGSRLYLSKQHLLFALPLAAVPGDDGDPTRYTPTLAHTCWAGVGRYSLVGKVHMDAGRNPRLFLRSLEQRQFLPFTDVQITFPDGSGAAPSAVLVNRFHLELLALEQPLS